ncbi:uncharacterized protein LOC132904023 [Amyelois transitella]|uniref:uncharacterized protein LOC132904023 n=1 Tax=Amyelois transitella TaxID=680683 RepID=UPI00299004D5|nr:uncharacterized protein LOC132904023 [Amyelois transitella]
MLLIFMFSSKLDSQTLAKWEEYRNTLEDIPNLNNFKQFLINRADVLEAINRTNYDINSSNKRAPSFARSPQSQKTNSANNKNTKNISYTKSFASTNSERTNVFVCIICGDNHRIYDCAIFKAKSVQDKLSDVKKFKLCSNCLRQGHPLNECRMGPCRECKKRHNTLLHDPDSNKTSSTTESNIAVNHSSQNQQQVLLSTALIEVCNPVTRATSKVRALLDSGSQSSFISSSLKDELALNSTRIDNLRIIGIGNSNCNNVTESCTIKINSINTPFSVQLSCLVLNELTSGLPKTPIDIKTLKLPSSIVLADPTFYQPSKVDVLIGADLFWHVLGGEQRNLGPNLPKLHSSKFGWLISGPIYTKVNYNSVQCNHASVLQNADDEIHRMLPIFWNLEEVPNKTKLSDKDKFCEKHFLLNTTRLENGRFCVKLPLIDEPDCLGDTYALAKKRFINLEKRFKRNPTLKLEYSKFINEYKMLGHLTEITTKPEICYFLCHHAVLKETSESTKLRVVFDGSAPSTSGYSLNDILLSGPNIQDSLFSILVRARQYKYLLTGDIEKMYRQVEVTEPDRDLQLILWREKESDPIKILKLNTLTYGTASASYLSTRCVYQLGEECEDELIKNIIQSDFYVDDLITGCNNEIQLHYIQNKIANVLSSGCFNLRKYKSNLPSLVQDINSSSNSQESLMFSESTSTLGLGWNPVNDTLHFPTIDVPQNTVVTKRFILSQSFKIFDPLGILSPFIIIPKIMLQKLWLNKIDWDQPVPKDIEMSWNSFQNNVPSLRNLHIPRLTLSDDALGIEMHSFSDASQHAYGACVYMRSISTSGTVTVRLLCAKSRVAPVKPTTMPRLELCAALLSARLCKSVTDALKYSPMDS